MAIDDIIDKHFPENFMFKVVDLPSEGLTYAAHMQLLRDASNGLNERLVQVLSEARTAGLLSEIDVPSETDFMEITSWNEFVRSGDATEMAEMRGAPAFMALRSSMMIEQVGAHLKNASALGEGEWSNLNKSDLKLSQAKLAVALKRSSETVRRVLTSGDAEEVTMRPPRISCFETGIVVDFKMNDIYAPSLAEAPRNTLEQTSSEDAPAP